MKCGYCGANLIIDDEKCPFCGKPNPVATKHRREMGYFKKKFKRTEEEVRKESGRYNRFTIKISVIAVLIALNLLVVLAHTFDWEIRNMMSRYDITKHLTEYKTQLNEYEQNHQYMEFMKYYRTKNLDCHDAFEEYKHVYYVCSSYVSVYNDIISLQTYNKEFDSDIKDNLVENLARQLDNMYKYSEPNAYSKDIWFSPEHVATMDEVKERTGYLLRVYCNLTEEQIAKLPALSRARKEIMLEERMGINEE